MNLQSYGDRFTQQFEQLPLIFAVVVAAYSFKIVTWERNKIKRLVTCHKKKKQRGVTGSF
jgi:hypothetical protein